MQPFCDVTHVTRSWPNTALFGMLHAPNVINDEFHFIATVINLKEINNMEKYIGINDFKVETKIS